MKRLFTSTIVLLLLSVPAFATDTEIEERENESGDEFHEIVVSATRYDELLSSVPANITIISGDDLSNTTARNIPDLLRNVTGIHVNDISGNGRSYTVDLRGFGETAVLNTLVLVDGRRVNQADLSGTDWSQIPLDRVERIEIIRGGRASILYGDNASGGVVNIITKKGDKLKSGVNVSAGSYETFKTSAFLGGSTNDLSYELTGSYYSSDGYRNNSNTEVRDFGVNLDYSINESVNVNVSSGYHSDSTGLPGALRDSDFASGLSRRGTTNPSDYADVEDYYIKGAPEISLGDYDSVTLDTSFRKRDSSTFASFIGGSFTGNTTIKTITLSPQLLMEKKIGTFNNIVTLGFDYQNSHEDIVNDSIFFGSQTIGEFELEKENYGFYMHDEISLTDNFLFSGGYRYDRADFTFKPSTPESTKTDAHSFTAGINYSFLKKSYFYLSYARSFRYPVLDEFFSFFTNTIDTSLIPQRSDNYEFGIRYYFNDTTYLHTNFFLTDTEHEIFYNLASFLNENLDGNTQRRGIEISFEVKITEWLSFNGGYSYIDATIDGGQYGGNIFPGVPRHQATFNTIVNGTKDFSIVVNGHFIGTRPFIGDFDGAFDDQDEYAVINIKLKYVKKPFTIFADINNVFDEEYSEYGVIGTFPTEKAFFPSPEFNFLIGLTAEF
jgi:iron complex outermembrane receptor protein